MCCKNSSYAHFAEYPQKLAGDLNTLPGGCALDRLVHKKQAVCCDSVAYFTELFYLRGETACVDTCFFFLRELSVDIVHKGYLTV